MVDKETIAMILFATNARFRIATRFTTNNQTGYEIRPECDLFGRKKIPKAVAEVLVMNGIPVQNRYTDVIHLRKLLRITKDWVDFTKDPEGWTQVLRFNGVVPQLKTHDDVEAALEVIEGEPL